MLDKTLAEYQADLNAKTLSSVELTQSLLTQIEQLDPQLNSFITVDHDGALAAAQAADAARARGDTRPLLGLPIAQKDIFCTQGVKTSCGSKMLDNFIAPYDATSVSQFKHAGMVMLGKTNMDEFAMGSSNENSIYGDVKNPWDLTRVPGGSSGGSAAAVAAGLTPAATGTDTGGSIRQPASMCNITGLKPTYGRVSRYGLIAYASSLDQGGPFARSAEDVAMLMNAMAGFDPKDSTSIDEPVPDYTATLNQSLQGLKIGLPIEYFNQGLDPKMQAAIHTAAKTLEQLGATLTDINLPHSNLAIPTYYIIAPAECSSNLARYDGLRYGYRCDDPKDLMDLYCRTRGEAFGREVKRRMLIGTYVLSAGYYDAYYVKAQKVRRLIRQDYLDAYQQVDVILSPTCPTPAFKLGEKTDDPLTMYFSDIFTIAVNLAGLPGMSVPAGFVDDLPVGMQLIGNYFKEAQLLNVAHQYQQHTDWHTRRPPLLANLEAHS